MNLSLQPAPHDFGEDAWTCTQGMSALAKAMAQGLPVELQQTVDAVEWKDGVWITRSKEGRIWSSRTILITSPLWQTAEFFKDTHPELKLQIQELARRVVYEPQWTLIIKLAPHSPVRGEVYDVNPHPAIASIYDQGRKGLPGAQGVLVVQASREFSEKNLEVDSSVVSLELSAVMQKLGWKLENAEIQAHRWRYARVKTPLGQKFVTLPAAPGLYLAGDFCLGSQVELAAVSGWAAADAIGHRKSFHF
jgi:predicted NAD/FAD-dependent oxidoreductase